MNKLKLPRLLSDGMVLQQKKRVRIWGKNQPGRKVMIFFLGEEFIGVTDEEGNWEIFLEGLTAGGPHAMHIRDESGNEQIIDNILIGDVWFCSGQSNMELPMERVKDKYPEEIKACDCSYIRTFKITKHVDFHAPLEEHLSGEWKAAKQDTILQFSATAYFFARSYYEQTGVPVGLINASLGGSRIESWMSREMLQGYDDFLQLADRYSDDEFVKGQLAKNEKQCADWHSHLDSMDIGLKQGWCEAGKQEEVEETVFVEKKADAFEKIDNEAWKPVELPFFFRDTELNGFIGSVWFKRRFWVPGEMAGLTARIFLGTIVDSDTVYINGVEIGHTDYQYPPRKYDIPEGVLQQGENTIVIRVKCEKGKGRFTPGKAYEISSPEGVISLAGEWSCRIGAECGEIKETDFVNWKPTGLYHGMTAPCHRFAIAGFLWYQGESNTHVPEPYLDLMTRMIGGYRKAWGDDSLPFFYVQLPNYAIDIHDSDTDETGYGWPAVRELQRQALSVENTGMVVAIDIGEDNDLHPLNKKEIGRRLALLATTHLYQKKEEASGPVIEQIICKQDEQGAVIEIRCSHAEGGLLAYSETKGKALKDFEVAGEDGIFKKANASLSGNRILVSCSEVTLPAKIRYCYKNTNTGGLVYNKAMLPMSPFEIEV